MNEAHEQRSSLSYREAQEILPFVDYVTHASILSGGEYHLSAGRSESGFSVTSLPTTLESDRERHRREMSAALAQLGLGLYFEQIPLEQLVFVAQPHNGGVGVRGFKPYHYSQYDYSQSKESQRRPLQFEIVFSDSTAAKGYMAFMARKPQPALRHLFDYIFLRKNQTGGTDGNFSDYRSRSDTRERMHPFPIPEAIASVVGGEIRKDGEIVLLHDTRLNTNRNVVPLTKQTQRWLANKDAGVTGQEVAQELLRRTQRAIAHSYQEYGWQARRSGKDLVHDLAPRSMTLMSRVEALLRGVNVRDLERHGIGEVIVAGERVYMDTGPRAELDYLLGALGVGISRFLVPFGSLYQLIQVKRGTIVWRGAGEFSHDAAGRQNTVSFRVEAKGCNVPKILPILMDALGKDPLGSVGYYLMPIFTKPDGTQLVPAEQYHGKVEHMIIGIQWGGSATEIVYDTRPRSLEQIQTHIEFEQRPT